MNTLRRTSAAFVGMIVACALVTAPTLAFADSCRQEKKKGHHRHASVQRHDRDDDRGRGRDRDRDRYDRYERRDRDDDRDGRRHRRYGREVRYVDRSPMFGIQVRVGAPVRPMQYVPVRDCGPSVVYVPVSQGPYYDSECRRHFSNFELYVEHVNDRTAAAVHIRN